MLEKLVTYCHNQIPKVYFDKYCILNQKFGIRSVLLFLVLKERTFCFDFSKVEFKVDMQHSVIRPSTVYSFG